MKTCRIKVRGRVQGVFFRKNSQETAVLLGLKGTVRNCRDGSVELEAQGPDEAIENLVDWCRKGPRIAEVTEVTSEWVERPAFDEFRIIR